MPGLQVYLFGPPRAERAGLVVTFRRRQTLALLAYLAATVQPHGRASLAALLWPESDEQRARSALRRILYDLERTLGKGMLDIEGDTVAMHPRPDLWIDTERFHRLMANVAAHKHPPRALCDACLADLTEATTLYRGDFLAGFTLTGSAEFDDWQTLVAESRRLELAAGLQGLAHGLAQRQELSLATQVARRWLALDSLEETAHRLLMQLYAQAGERAALVRQYEECSRLLAAELGVAPAQETSELYRALMESPAVVLDAGQPRTPALPPDATPFIGRIAELDLVAQRLADPGCRLLTIHGPGGIGKTRLALRAAREAAASFAHGACFVDLAPIESTDLLAPAILRALGVSGPAPSGADQRLVDFLSDRHLLLLLDNYEHLLAGPEPHRRDGYGLVTQIVAAAPRLKLLITSRTRLNIPAEWLVPLHGMASASEEYLSGLPLLAAPPQATAAIEGYSATLLFLACLRRQQPGFLPSAADARCIARICRLLEGIPLAIELAAGWTRVMALDEIARRLEQGLELLVSRMRGVPARQRSMTATFDYSWQLLTLPQRSFLRRLSVFRGGFSAEAAEQVAGAELSDLADLADASWLNAGAGGRYVVHELVRQYWAEKLEGDDPAESKESTGEVRGRHAGYYATLLAGRWVSLYERPGAIAELASDWGNLVAAWDWAVAQVDLELVRGLGMGLALLGDRLGANPEVARLLETGLDRLRQTPDAEWGGQRPAVVALLLTLQAERLRNLGQFEREEACVRESAAWLDRADTGEALTIETNWLHRRTRAVAMGDRGDYAGWERLIRKLLAEAQSESFRMWPYSPGSVTQWLIHLHWGHGGSLMSLGEWAQARRVAEHGLALAEELGSELGRGYILHVLAFVLLQTGQYWAAERAARQMLGVGSKFGDTMMIAAALPVLGYAEFMLGRHDLAGSTWRRGLALARQAGLCEWADMCRIGLGDIELARRNLAAARRLYEASCASDEPAGTPTPLAALSAHVGLGRVALLEGSPAEALEHFRQVLSAQVGRASIKAEALAYAAEALLRQDEAARSAQVCGFLSGWPGTPYHVKQTVEGLLAELAGARRLTADEVAACQQKGRDCGLDEIVAQITGPD